MDQRTTRKETVCGVLSAIEPYMKKLLPEAVLFCAILFVVGYGFAQTWRLVAPPSYLPVTMAESADGGIIMVVGSSVGPVISTNSGLAWNMNSDLGGGFGIALSADGTRALGVFYGPWPPWLGLGHAVCVSTNTGSTWTPADLPAANWGSCASSADGVMLAAASYNGLIYTSTNSGATWLSNDVPAKNWRSIASSADGTKLAAAASSDYIYTSTNSGLSWTPGGAIAGWRSVASSANGICLAATGDGGTYVSTNFGGDWAEVLSAAGYGIACSADGGRLIMCSSSVIYTSTDFGNTWASTNILGRQWLCVASSTDGCRLLAGENAGGVWIYETTPCPHLDLAVSANQVVLSWLVPSTKMVMQENVDLASSNWVTLTNVPSLNLTNLKNEMNLLPSGGGGFFRLSASP